MKKIMGITLLVLLIDQASKLYIKTHFALGEQTEILPWFKLAFVENPGMAYGLQFGGLVGKYLLSLLRVVLVIFMFFYFKKLIKQQASNWFVVPLAMVFAGAIGNLIDGMFYGLIFDSGTSLHAQTGYWIGYEGVSQYNTAQHYAGFMNGCVVDMLYFPLFSFNWPTWLPVVGGEHFEFFKPVFNIADSAITIGVAIMLIFKKKAFPNGFNL
jgi:signal peptidase II